MGQSKEPIKLRKRKTPSGMESEESGNAETCRGYPGETARGASEQRIWFQVPVQGG